MLPGLRLIHDVITPELERELVAWIDELPPALPLAPPRDRARSLTRERVDLYGHGRFNEGYQSARWVSDTIPAMLGDLASSLHLRSILPAMPDAVTISEYLPGQGVGMHTDRSEAGPVIVGVALISECTIRFQADIGAPTDIHYPARSALVIAGPCRYPPWRHSILPVPGRRISIVFRRSD